MLELRKLSVRRTYCLAALMVILLLLLGSAACTSKTESGKLNVVATIMPLADFVRNVGGDRVEVTTLMSAGASPHTYEPLPAQVKTIADAQIMVINGAGLEFWIEKMVDAAGGPDLVIVDTSMFPAIEGSLLTGDGYASEGSEQGVNPHIWLDPVLAQKQVEAITQALIIVDPANKQTYLENASAYVAELKALDEEIGNATDTFSIREFIAFHPAWTYFANRYGLVEAAVIEEAPGKEPSAADIRNIVDTARELEVRAIFAEPQFSSKAAETIAAASGAEVLFLDPLGGAGLEGRDTYIGLMRYNVDQMKLAMA